MWTNVITLTPQHYVTGSNISNENKIGSGTLTFCQDGVTGSDLPYTQREQFARHLSEIRRDSISERWGTIEVRPMIISAYCLERGSRPCARCSRTQSSRLWSKEIKATRICRMEYQRRECYMEKQNANQHMHEKKLHRLGKNHSRGSEAGCLGGSVS